MPLDALVHAFAGNPLDRKAATRADEKWLDAQLGEPSALVVAMWNGKPLVRSAPGEPDGAGVRLAYLSADEARAVAGRDDRPLFLGLWADAPVFSVDIDLASDPTHGPLAGLGRFEDLRAVALALPVPEAGIVGTAKSLFDWRRRHGFCSACGNRTEAGDGGWKGICPECGTEHFPRVDPVVIMLPVCGDRCLLGRNVGWPAGRMSALAGFVEPGESVEEACAREMKEEAGLRATRVFYHSSQPWPWPSSLMIGLIAEVEDDHAVPDGVELEEVRWFTREEARTVLDGHHAHVSAPAPLGIARQLFLSWAEGSRA